VGTVTLVEDHSTQYTRLVELAAAALVVLRDSSQEMSDALRLPDIAVKFRITDTFVSEVNSGRDPDRPPFGAERAGGTVAAITLQDKAQAGSHLVLVNGAALGSEPWHATHIPATIAHELSHCLTEECRLLHGHPKSYSASPGNPIEVTGFIALRLWDEYLADSLAMTLMPPMSFTLNADDGPLTATDRLVLGADRLAIMHEALDQHAYPGLGNLVRAHLRSHADLSEMTTTVLVRVQEVLTMGVHFQTALREFPHTDELDRVERHAGFKLYIAPFWESVGPVFDGAVAACFTDFAATEQRCFDSANAAVITMCRSLGLTFELLESGEVFVWVNEPTELS